MTQAEYEKTDSYKRRMWLTNHEDEANIIVGWKTFESLLEKMPQLAEISPQYQKHYPGWADREGLTGEGYLQFSLTFIKDEEDYPEVKLPETNGWAESDVDTVKAILIKQKLKKKYEVLNQIDSFIEKNKLYRDGLNITEHLTLTYKIWSDAETSDGEEFYDYFCDEDITDEEINEFNTLINN